MAIQTQGFQFQNLARYTPVDPTLVGVDFSRIGSGIADAMKLGSSLQQYQMRKQAMEEEAATRESRIAQANAVARLASAEATERLQNVATLEAARAEQARSIQERERKLRESGIFEFGPKADVERAKGVIALTPETTALTLAQLQADRAMLPLAQEAKTVGLTRQIAAGRRGILTDEQVENMSMQQQLLGLAAGGLKLGREQAEIVNTEADTRLKNAQALAASMKDAVNPLPVLKELNDQINLLESRPVAYENGTVTNLLVYEGRMAARARGEKEGIPFINRDLIKQDPTLNKHLERLNELRSIRDSYEKGITRKPSGGAGSLGGGGMAINVPTLGGQAQAGTPYLDNLSATIQRAIGERLGGGVAQIDQSAQVSQAPAISPPVLEDLINASVTTPTAGVVTGAPAAPAAAQGPAATMEIKDGKVVPVKSVMERAEGATKAAIEFAKEKPVVAAMLASQAPKAIKPVAQLTGTALKSVLSATPKIISGTGQLIGGARLAGGRLLPATILNEFVFPDAIRTDQTRKEEADMSSVGTTYQKLARLAEWAGFSQKSALGRAARLAAQSMYEPEGSRQIQDEIEGLSEEIKSIGRSNLTAAEKIAQINPLREQMGELIKQSMAGKYSSIRSVPSASGGIPVVSPGGTALLFPGITSIAPATESVAPETQMAEELTGPLVESDRVSSNTPIKVVDLEVVLRERPAGPWSEPEIRAINKAREEGTLPVIAYDNNFRINFARQNAPQIMDRLPVIGR